jgi:hypothetical protein
MASVTGADCGIGRAVAVLFAREGADIAIRYLAEDLLRLVAPHRPRDARMPVVPSKAQCGSSSSEINCSRSACHRTEARARRGESRAPRIQSSSSRTRLSFSQWLIALSRSSDRASPASLAAPEIPRSKTPSMGLSFTCYPSRTPLRRVGLYRMRRCGSLNMLTPPCQESSHFRVGVL